MSNNISFTETELVSARREVEALHAFFASWYNGEGVNSDKRFSRFTGVMDGEFHMITPNGDVFDRETVLGFVREGWGQFGDTDNEFAIEIRGFRAMRRISSDTIQVIYEEWQSEPGYRDEDGLPFYRGRLSAAGLRADDRTDNGWIWLFVHEVWLPE